MEKTKARIKAEELVNRFYHLTAEYGNNQAKQCALICVDEILKSLTTGNTNFVKYCDNRANLDFAEWLEVKSELEKV